jgi:hypothetical protein
MSRAQPRTLSGSEETRIFLGLMVQPFIAAGLAFVSSPLMEWSGRAIYGGIDVDPVHLAITQAFGAGVAAFFVSILAALPSAVFVLERHELTLRRALLCRGAAWEHPEPARHTPRWRGLRDRGAGAPRPLRVISRNGRRCSVLGGLGAQPASAGEAAARAREPRVGRRRETETLHHR